MESGTSVKPTYMCVHTICETLAISQDYLTNIIPFQAITRCNTVSHIVGLGMRTAGKAFCSNPDLLANLGSDDLHDETCKLAEKFICRMYNLVMRTAVIMHGWLCLASAYYLKHCYLQVMRYSCTYNELVTSQWRGFRQHVTFHLSHNQKQRDGQRDTGNLFPS